MFNSGCLGRWAEKILVVLKLKSKKADFKAVKPVDQHKNSIGETRAEENWENEGGR